jgi:hypothetical protein
MFASQIMPQIHHFCIERNSVTGYNVVVLAEKIAKNAKLQEQQNHNAHP